MAAKRTQTLVGVLAGVFRDTPESCHTDGELLTAFLDRRDPSSFGELVRRHGPMVLGVCRRVLRHTQDAEDAFQATFLVLAQKAGAVSPRNAVGNWLYGVAFQTAVRVRAVRTKQKTREVGGVSIPESASPEAVWDDVAVVLDEELARLPNRYRAVIVLCDVEGRTRADAANHLGCPEGSVSSRLSRARGLLARRLEKRGVTLSAGGLAAMVGQNAISAAVSSALTKGTIEAVVLGGKVAPAVATLTDKVLKAMFLSKIKFTAVLVALVGMFGFGAVLTLQPVKARTGVPTATPAVKGKDVNGVEKVQATDLEKLQGRWKMVEVYDEDGDIKANKVKSYAQMELALSGEREEYYWAKTGQRFSEGKFKIDTAQNPKWIDFWDINARGKSNTLGVYTLDGDTFTFCVNYDGERPADFTVKPGAGRKRFVYERITAEKDKRRLQGTWVAADLKSWNLDCSLEEEFFFKDFGHKVTFSGDEIRRPDTAPNVKADERSYRLDATKTPQVMEVSEAEKLVAKVNYEFDGESLKLFAPRKPGSDATDGSDITRNQRAKFFVMKRDVPTLKLPEFRPGGQVAAPRKDGSFITVLQDAPRPAYESTVRPAGPGNRNPEQAIRALAANGDEILKNDFNILAKSVAGVQVGEVGKRKPLAEFYTVVVYPKVGLLPTEPGEKPLAAFAPGKITTLADAIEKFGAPESRENWVGKLAKLHAGEGEVNWWGCFGVRADSQGAITHILWRHPLTYETEAAPKSKTHEFTPEMLPRELFKVKTGELIVVSHKIKWTDIEIATIKSDNPDIAISIAAKNGDGTQIEIRIEGGAKGKAKITWMIALTDGRREQGHITVDFE